MKKNFIAYIIGNKKDYFGLIRPSDGYMPIYFKKSGAIARLEKDKIDAEIIKIKITVNPLKHN